MDDLIARLRMQLQVLRRDAPRWIAYHGPGRLVAMATGGIIVIAAGWWLVRPAATPIEATLPRVATSLQTGTTPGSGSGVTPANAPGTSSGRIRVHVAGAVRSPGVYSLPATARLVDAVAAAGGASSTADLDRINLAQSLLDAEQVFVPRRGTIRSATTVAARHRPRRTPATTSTMSQVSVPSVAPDTNTTPAMPAPATSPTSAPNLKVNLNTATAEQLDALPGVGPSTARAIVSYRARRGPFAKVEDLLNIDGIGPKKLDSIKSFVEL